MRLTGQVRAPEGLWRLGRRAAHLFRSSGLIGNVAVGICFVGCVLAALGPVLVRNATTITTGVPFQGPSMRYLLGLDQLARNELSELIVAVRVAVVAAGLAVAVAACAGTTLGVIAGYRGGALDHAIGWVFDFLFSVPSYLFGILVVVVLGPGLVHAALAIGVALTPQFGRIARGAAAEVRGRAYVEAARLSGRRSWWIMRRHVLRNIMTPIAVMVGLSLANAEGGYAVLSYLGFGVSPPEPDYGSMIAAGQGYLLTDPWLVIFPSVVLVVLIIGFALLGDWIGERLDPQRRARRWLGRAQERSHSE
jgi:peptide/nickel transport system permease protein